MKVDFSQHPAVKLPDDEETLQESIVDMARTLANEAPLYLQQTLKTGKPETDILWTLSQKETVSRHSFLDGNTELEQKAFNTSLCRLRKKLHAFDASINGKRTLSLDATGKALVGKALDRFRANSQTVCGILGTKSLRISDDSLPANRQRLHSMLENILEFIRVDPVKSGIADLGFSGNKTLILCVYAAALRDGSDFVFKHRLGMAVFPIFRELSEEYTPTFFDIRLHQLRKKLKCPKKGKKQSRGYYIPIEPEFRTLLQPFVANMLAKREAA